MAERSPATRRSLGVVLAAVFAFLYIPIGVLIALSFNEGGLPTVWSGFSLKWYASLAANGQILSAALNTLIVALVSTVIATRWARCSPSASRSAGARARRWRR
jgi:spermidine/putrescine transport system permease protein